MRRCTDDFNNKNNNLSVNLCSTFLRKALVSLLNTNPGQLEHIVKDNSCTAIR